MTWMERHIRSVTRPEFDGWKSQSWPVRWDETLLMLTNAWRTLYVIRPAGSSSTVCTVCVRGGKC